jgi:hypothetical protein
MGRECGTYGRQERCAYRVLVGRPGGRISLGRPRRRMEDNITMDLQEVGWGGTDWIDLAQERDNWWATCRNEPSDYVRCGEFLD